MIKHPFIVYDDNTEHCVTCGVPVPLGMGSRYPNYVVCALCNDNRDAQVHSFSRRGANDIGPTTPGDGRIIRKRIGAN